MKFIVLVFALFTNGFAASDNHIAQRATIQKVSYVGEQVCRAVMIASVVQLFATADPTFYVVGTFAYYLSPFFTQMAREPTWDMFITAVIPLIGALGLFYGNRYAAAMRER